MAQGPSGHRGGQPNIRAVGFTASDRAETRIRCRKFVRERSDAPTKAITQSSHKPRAGLPSKSRSVRAPQITRPRNVPRWSAARHGPSTAAPAPSAWAARINANGKLMRDGADMSAMRQPLARKLWPLGAFQGHAQCRNCRCCAIDQRHIDL